MRVDQPRHHDRPAPVDPAAAGTQAAAHGGDPAVAHGDVALRQIAHGRIHAQHIGTADDECLPARERPRGPPAVPAGGKRRRAEQRERAQARRAAHELPPVDRPPDLHVRLP
jgi:hypothetical protein